MAQKVGTQGGKGGNSWDDGSDYDGVTKIQVAAGWDGIQYVKFDYVKNGEVKEAPLRGVKGRSCAAEPFVINHPEEYLVSVEGWYCPDGLIQGLNFISNKKTSDLIGFEDGVPFTLQVENKKIIGFHGFAGDSLNSLGAYFVPLTNSTPLIPAKKLEAKGAKVGAVWDDGVHDGVKKVYVGKGQDGTIAFLKFEYHKESQKVVGDEHGKKTVLKAEEFEVDADDYIVYAEGYHDKVSGVSNEIITSIRFRTYKGKTSELFGINSGTKFVLQGGKIVGFHGHATDVLHSLGAYITLQSTQNLQGKWLKMEQKGTAPGLRCSHDIAAVGNKIYSFGGEFTPNQPIDKHLYVYDINTKTWSIAPATGDVPHLACLGVRMVSIGTTLYVFGGRDASRKYNGFYSYDTIKNEWKLLTPLEEGPTPRSFHSMAADDKNVYVFGGVSATTRLKTLDVYNIVDKKWVQLPSPGDSFSIRGGAGLEVVNGKVWVVYGFTGHELDDIHYFDVAENKWTKVETLTGQKPCGRSVFASAAVGKYIIVFGGEVEMDPLAHEGPGHLIDGTFALDTETLKWERLDKSEEEGPNPRGWSASTTATVDGKKGLAMLGGKAQNNDRFDDLYFYGVESA